MSGAITAFYKDLSARGHKDRLMIMTFSEFGRRAKENGSKGTDHGSGAPMFLVGGKVKAGLVGEHPSLEKLETGTSNSASTSARCTPPSSRSGSACRARTCSAATFKPVEVFA